MPEMLQENEITMDRIEELLKSVSMPCSRDAGGALRYDDDGVKTFIKVDADKKLVILFSVWRLKESSPMEKKLAWANELNKRLLLAKFQVVKPDMLWCDYQFRYEGGLNPAQLTSTVRLFAKACRGAGQNDPAGIIVRE